jgi:uncharacterized protein (TIGR02246 family)
MRQAAKAVRNVAGGLAAAAVVLGLAARSGAAEPGKAAGAAAGPTAPMAAAEKAIRDSAREFVRAFNAGDAASIAALWTPDAEYTDETGGVFRGREAIAAAYGQLFARRRGSTIAVTIESIRFLAPSIATEKGIAQVTPSSGGPPTAARYTVVHVNRDGKWLMAVGHEAPYVSGGGPDHLKDLQWLIGQWLSESTVRPLRLKFEWMAQRNFIRNTYSLSGGDPDAIAGAQVIGWNPKLGRIVSWHFHSEGGFGSDVWIKDGEKWVIEATGVSADGSVSASVNVLTPLDANTYTWRSIKRSLDGVSLPSTPPVKITRVK